MKYFKILLVLLFPICLSAQVTHPDPELNKFVGTWKWSSGNDEVTITLQKQILLNHRTGETSEVLVGWHSYIRNSILVESSMQYVGEDINVSMPTTAGDLKITLLGFTRSTTKVRFSTFWDLTLHKDCKLEIELLPGSTTQLTWNVFDGDGIYNGPAGTAGLFTMPLNNIVLTKQ